MERVTDDQYVLLFTFRRAVLEFLRWSQQRVKQAGITEQQYLLLLAVRAKLGAGAPSIGDVASDLMIAPSSAVELVRRAEALDLVRRQRDVHDQRVVRLVLSDHGEQLLDALASAHLAELDRAARTLHISEEFLGRLSADFLEIDLVENE